MTNEEMERRLEFVINQQAQFVSDIHQLRQLISEQEAKFAGQIDKILGTLGAHADAIVRLVRT